ncbi:MAG: exodeoxyribonuclease VII small subunit [Eggerthellaceae bacterium]|jgi:exodeoxyribonuclease VII small subunit|uniref:Exodeoxyribonuclease 7 small subunit n=1 Tax=Denitrobacterium detoxificans TaxID=79604 RepID=A0A172RYL6_9ACTN|nr:exodeoxyribonuclease VII small subunit [Denitrobacterium detoxificans]ANE22820.1 exodeoxyribonuclease VII small subunit [Denitrobacterium detoxificans]MBE6465983.1 exodeoxyribonuclease VII small subunit [Denitrobacterium detoxificans]MCR5583267.1 exodeoxyribonuclease VII small subunit [Eggerthellaceae bacterium]SEO68440.1 Exodeoxyribonuclease VII small subunit [Denitrobacterium detoxificans]
MPEAQETPISELSFRQAMAQLDQIVAQLESNTLELEDSLAAYERGVALLRELRGRLDGAQQKVDALMGELEQDATDDEIDTTLHKA